MRRQMGMSRVQFATELFYELSDRVADVGDKGVLAWFCHESSL
jgi:hypothetical protein